jgi:hypothetical protein
MVDFIMLAQYHSHSDETIDLMEKALKKLDKEKSSFSQFRTLTGETKELFNFPKWHAMTHYAEHIR